MTAGLKGHGFLTGDVPAMAGEACGSVPSPGGARGGVPTLASEFPPKALSESAASADSRLEKGASDMLGVLLGEPLRVLASDIAIPVWLEGRCCRRLCRLPFLLPDCMGAGLHGSFTSVSSSGWATI